MRILLSLLLIASSLFAADIIINTSTPDVQAAIEALTPADDVIFEAGTYTFNHFRLIDLHGTPDNWITIKAAEGAAVILQGNSSYNMIDFYNAGYIELIGLEIQGSSDGIKFNAGSTAHHVLIEDCNIHDINGVGISSQADEVSYVTVRNCRITNCPTCGFYLGSADGTDIVHHWTIDQCYVSFCGGDPDTATGYGIEIKANSYANIIEDSVWHDVAGTSRAGVAVYSTGKGTVDRNIVRRNAVWNVPRNGDTASGTPGIWANAEAVIENNIVFDCGSGFYSNPNPVAVTDLTIAHNTFYGNYDYGLYGAAGADNLAANNAAYGAGTYISLNAGWANVTNFTGCICENEFASKVFGDSRFLYPKLGSILINNGTPGYAGHDFNGTPRPFGIGADIGAYEWIQDNNPGWRIAPEPKDDVTITLPSGGGGSSDSSGGCLPGSSAGLSIIIACFALIYSSRKTA